MPGNKRRDFLKLAGSVWGSTLIASNIPAMALAAVQARDQLTLRSLSATEAADLEAIAARIIPTTDTPGAREAGAIWFIDQALAGELAATRPILTKGLATLQADAKRRFSELEETAQDELLGRHDSSEFFSHMRFLTVAGTFAMSNYGGNRDNRGWQILGFDHRHVWTPPFGYYDSQAGYSGATQK